MWCMGTIRIIHPSGQTVPVKYQVKVGSANSGSHVLKLCLWIDGKKAATYDRGWDKLPASWPALQAAQILFRQYSR